MRSASLVWELPGSPRTARGRAGFADFAKSRRIEGHASFVTGLGAAVTAGDGALGAAHCGRQMCKRSVGCHHGRLLLGGTKL